MNLIKQSSAIFVISGLVEFATPDITLASTTVI